MMMKLLVAIVSAVLLLPCILLPRTNYMTVAFSPSQLAIYNDSASAIISFRRRKCNRLVGVPLAATARKKNDDDDDKASTTTTADSGRKKKDRRPWDMLRFVSQSSKFIKPLSLPQFIIGSAGKNMRRIGSGMYGLFCVGMTSKTSTSSSNSHVHIFVLFSFNAYY
jgi:hypothetical protein